MGNKKLLRVGVVGLGHRGRWMFRLANMFDFAESVAGCDIRTKNWYEVQYGETKSFAEQYPDATFYESYDEMLEKAELDVVIVETGADVHAEFCVKALEANINVLTDIPVVANLKEAEALWRAAEKSTATISVGANPNEQRFVEYLTDFYNKGLLGKPYCMEAEYIHWEMPGSAFHKELYENGDWRKLLCPIRYCTHSLGPLLTVLDEELRLVSCFGTGAHAEESLEESRDDMCCAQFRTDSGVVVRLMRNGRCRADIGHHNYRVFGTEGYIERIERFGKPVIRYNSMRELDTSLKEVEGRFLPLAYQANPNAMEHDGLDYAMMDHFLTAIINGSPAPISLKAGLEMTLPGIYAEESAKRLGQVMRMRYPWDEDWKAEFD